MLFNLGQQTCCKGLLCNIYTTGVHWATYGGKGESVFLPIFHSYGVFVFHQMYSFQNLDPFLKVFVGDYCQGFRSFLLVNALHIQFRF
jgi:hypothetical protein